MQQKKQRFFAGLGWQGFYLLTLLPSSCWASHRAPSSRDILLFTIRLQAPRGEGGGFVGENLFPRSAAPRHTAI